MDKSIEAKANNTYLELCAEAYDLRRPRAPSDAYAFYRAYAKAAQGLILEPMCGSGRFLIPLLEEGFSVHGFDASHYMLDRLYKKATAKSIHVNVWHASAQDLDRSEKYDLIFIPSGSFCLITDLDEAQAALEKFYNHLKDAGIFLFEVDTLQSVPQQNVWHGSIWPKTNGQKIIFSHLSMLQEDICMSICKHELVEGNQIIHTEIEPFNVRIYEQDQLTVMLKNAGFKHIRVFKTFDLQKQPDEQDETIVYECKK